MPNAERRMPNGESAFRTPHSALPAADLERLFDRCTEEARGGRDPEAILSEHPEAAEEIRPLLSLAGEMARLPAPQPSEASLAKLFAHLARETAQQELRPPKETAQPELRPPKETAQRELRPPAEQAPASPSPARPRKRFLRLRGLGWAAAALFVVFLTGWSMVSASASALPGDWLYPIKRVTERATYILTVGPDHRAELRIRFADQRLEEAVRVHRQGGGIDTRLLRAMLGEAIQALEAADRLPETSRNLLMERAACSCQLRCRMLGALLRKASAEERKAIQPFIDCCDAGCRCVDDECGDEPAMSPAEAAARMREALPRTATQP